MEIDVASCSRSIMPPWSPNLGGNKRSLKSRLFSLTLTKYYADSAKSRLITRFSFVPNELFLLIVLKYLLEQKPLKLLILTLDIYKFCMWDEIFDFMLGRKTSHSDYNRTEIFIGVEITKASKIDVHLLIASRNLYIYRTERLIL